jgi:hypothetical protein
MWWFVAWFRHRGPVSKPTPTPAKSGVGVETFDTDTGVNPSLVAKFESYIRTWMKNIQELLLESEQLRLETDDAGPQVSLYKFINIVFVI